MKRVGGALGWTGGCWAGCRGSQTTSAEGSWMDGASETGFESDLQLSAPLRFGSSGRQAAASSGRPALSKGAASAAAAPTKGGRLGKLSRAAGMSSSALSTSSSSSSSGADASSASSASDSDSDSSGGSAAGGWGDVFGPRVDKTVHNVVTSDGVTLVLVRGVCAAARAPGAPTRREHPILMIPGLASAADTTFDLSPEYSLFEHLAREGYDVWRADLRGNGRSGCPNSSIREPGWNVDDHLFIDMPAIMAYVLEETGARQVHWVGHSMGGMLATGALSLQGYLSRHIRSVTMLGSGCYGAGSWYSYTRPLLLAMCALGFPGGFMSWLFSKLFVGTWGSNIMLGKAVETLFYWTGNTEVEVGKKLLADCFRYIPRGLVTQFLESINTDDGLATVDGRFKYCDPKVLAHVDTPVLGVCGDWDLFCPAPGGLRTVQQYGGEHRRFVFLGPGYGTAKEHYGHFDVIVGARARDEAWPYVTAHLEQHDAPVVVPGGLADDDGAEAALEAGALEAEAAEAGAYADAEYARAARLEALAARARAVAAA